MPQFDPYFTWLGIHTDGRPPNHYELLGVELFESDLATIEEAALRRIVLLRSIASGEYERLVSQILNEISAARLCLCNDLTRSEYDTEILILPPAEKHDAQEAIAETTRRDDRESHLIGGVRTATNDLASEITNVETLPNDQLIPSAQSFNQIENIGSNISQPLRAQHRYAPPAMGVFKIDNDSSNKGIPWLIGALITGLCIVIVFLFLEYNSQLKTEGDSGAALNEISNESEVERNHQTRDLNSKPENVLIQQDTNTDSNIAFDNNRTVVEEPLDQGSLVRMQFDGNLNSQAESNEFLQVKQTGVVKYTDDRFNRRSQALQLGQVALGVFFKSDFQPPEEFTISFWINPVTNPGKDQVVLEWGDLTVFIDGTTNQLMLQLSESSIIQTHFYITNRWHFISLAFGDQLECTINGVQYLNGRHPTATIGPRLLIGSNGSRNRPYFGAIDEFTVLKSFQDTADAREYYLETRPDISLLVPPFANTDHKKPSQLWSQSDLSSVQDISFSMDSSQLAVGLADNLITVWKTRDPEQNIKLRSHESRVTSIDFNYRDGLLASGSADSTFKIWDTRQEYSRETNAIPNSEQILVEFANQGNSIFAHGISAVASVNAVFIDEQSNKTSVDLKGIPGQIVQFAAHPTANIASWLSTDGNLYQWNFATEEISTLGFEGLSSIPSAMTYSRYGDFLVVGYESGDIALYDVVAEKLTETVTVSNGKISQLIWGSNADCLVLLDSDNLVSIIQLTDPAEMVRLDIDSGVISAIAMDNRSQYIAVGTQGGTVSVWEIR